MRENKNDYVKKRFNRRYPNITDMNYYRFLLEYLELQDFAPNGNVFDGQSISDEAHFIMRTTTQYYLLKAFEAMRIDMTDDNVKEIAEEGNIGTPGRIAKVWCGDGTYDDRELGSGRWAVKPRLASFPNTGNKEIPITKRVDIISNCSHHNIVFSTMAREDSYAIISYIPDEEVLGISKLQRVTNHISQRFWLQEDLTKAIYDEIVAVAKTESVYVRLANAVHGCESFRGAKSDDGAFTSEYYGGKFKDIALRQSVIPN